MPKRRLTLSTALAALMLLASGIAKAVPAWQGWQWVQLKDGTPVEVRMLGDEWNHWIEDRNGLRYDANDDGTVSPAVQKSTPMHAASQARRERIARRQARRAAMKSQFIGEKRGLIVLVDFPDKHFTGSNAADTWRRIANENAFSDEELWQARGSVHDYFLDQSYGQFSLSFDVAGPVTMPKESAYYGQNDAAGNDEHFPELIEEACRMIDDDINFGDYDWNGDGEAEQVFFLYAGKGENSGRVASLIWPHMYWLSGWKEDGYTDYDRLLFDNTVIDTYACSCELNSYGSLDGMGTICHEFSHCLGLPDMYNTDSGMSVIGAWDLMDQGNYNGSGWCPANYSAYERSACGWLDLTVLEGDTTVTNMEALGSKGEAFRITNHCKSDTIDEYYILENRQQEGWDYYIPGNGLLITHIDFNQEIWDENTPNNISSHLRAAYIAAGNSMSSYNAAWPYKVNWSGEMRDSLSDTSSPAAKVFNQNIRGTKLMGIAIKDIANSNGQTSFSFYDRRTPKEEEPTGISDLADDQIAAENGSKGRQTEGTSAGRAPIYNIKGTRARTTFGRAITIENGRKSINNNYK